MTTDYEPDQVESSLAGWTAVLLVVFIGVSALMANWLFRGRVPADKVHEAAAYMRPPGPRLQVNEIVDRRAYLAAQQEELTTYSWVNRSEGVVRVPIERAMELLESQSNAAHAPERQGQ